MSDPEVKYYRSFIDSCMNDRCLDPRAEEEEEEEEDGIDDIKLLDFSELGIGYVTRQLCSKSIQERHDVLNLIDDRILNEFPIGFSQHFLYQILSKAFIHNKDAGVREKTLAVTFHAVLSSDEFREEYLRDERMLKSLISFFIPDKEIDQDKHDFNKDSAKLLLIFIKNPDSSLRVTNIFSLAIQRFLTNYFTIGQTLSLFDLGYPNVHQDGDDFAPISADPDGFDRVLSAIKTVTVDNRLKSCHGCLNYFYVQTRLLSLFVDKIINGFGLFFHESFSSVTLSILLETFFYVIESCPDTHCVIIDNEETSMYETLLTFSYLLDPISLMKRFLEAAPNGRIDSHCFPSTEGNARVSAITMPELKPLITSITALLNGEGNASNSLAYCSILFRLVNFFILINVSICNEDVFRALDNVIKRERAEHDVFCVRSISNYEALLLWSATNLNHFPSRTSLMLSLLEGLIFQYNTLKNQPETYGYLPDVMDDSDDTLRQSMDNVIKIVRFKPTPRASPREFSLDYTPFDDLCERYDYFKSVLISNAALFLVNRNFFIYLCCINRGALCLKLPKKLWGVILDVSLAIQHYSAIPAPPHPAFRA